MDRDIKKHAHSNVARLFSAFPDNGSSKASKPWAEASKYPNFYRTYIPGVGTEFSEVKDSGQGFEKTRGLAFAHKAQDRILWALVQFINNLSHYLTGKPLIDATRFQQDFMGLELHHYAASVNSQDRRGQEQRERNFDSTFSETLAQMRSALEKALPSPRGEMPNNMDRGHVVRIYVSTFGFSRGATEARAFMYWLVQLCKLDAKIAGVTPLTLGNIPVELEFMGLFDTVASVGLANSFFGFVDGHQAWADAEKALRIPGSEYLKKCVHLVSAHEVRRSFPLDSILVKNSLACHCEEIVFPGMHSDIGGGYLPKEQGRGLDAQGQDMLSRIPLAVMYRAARLHGVPLKLEKATPRAQAAFQIAPELIEAFNAYMSACGVTAVDGEEDSPQAGTVISGPLHELMASQHDLYIRWRKLRLGKMGSLASVQRANPHDRADIVHADQILQDEEVPKFEEWEKDPYATNPPREEWSRIRGYWQNASVPDAVANLFDNYVHDSRAGFKPTGDDISDLLDDIERMKRKEKTRKTAEENPFKYQPYTKATMPPALSRNEERKLELYRAHEQGDEEERINQGLEPAPEGQESYSISGAGYLRYRKIYMGNDDFKPDGALYSYDRHPKVAQSDSIAV